MQAEPLPVGARGVATYAEELARAASDAGAAEEREQRPEGRDDLRPAVASVLARVARRADPALIASLERAQVAWDQADSFSVLDEDLEAEVAAVRRRLSASAGAAESPARRAIALEGLLAVDGCVALVRLFERRLAALLRLRRRSVTPELLPEGRPFLDLGRALHEVVEAWR